VRAVTRKPGALGASLSSTAMFVWANKIFVFSGWTLWTRSWC